MDPFATHSGSVTSISISCIVNFAHLSRPKLIPMSLEKVATVSRSEFNCFSLDANNFRSSTKNEWLTKLFDFRPFPT